MKKKGDEKRIINVQLKLNPDADGEVVPKWQDNADISSKMNAVTKVFVNGELKK